MSSFVVIMVIVGVLLNRLFLYAVIIAITWVLSFMRGAIWRDLFMILIWFRVAFIMITSTEVSTFPSIYWFILKLSKSNKSILKAVFKVLLFCLDQVLIVNSCKFHIIFVWIFNQIKFNYKLNWESAHLFPRRPLNSSLRLKLNYRFPIQF